MFKQDICESSLEQWIWLLSEHFVNFRTPQPHFLVFFRQSVWGFYTHKLKNSWNKKEQLKLSVHQYKIDFNNDLILRNTGLRWENAKQPTVDCRRNKFSNDSVQENVLFKLSMWQMNVQHCLLVTLNAKHFACGVGRSYQK